MAGIYANQGKVEEAIGLYQQSLAIHEQIGNVHGKAATLVMMAQLVARQGNIDQAITLTRESLSILQRIGSWEAQAVQEILDGLTRRQNQ